MPYLGLLIGGALFGAALEGRARGGPRWLWLLAVPAAIAVFLGFASVGWAAETDGAAGAAVVDLLPLWEILIGLAIGVLGVLGRRAVRLLEDRLNLDKDAEVRSYLDDALFRAVRYAEAEAMKAGKAHRHVSMRSAVLADAAAYVVALVPDALAHFGVDAKGLERMLEARLDPPADDDLQDDLDDGDGDAGDGDAGDGDAGGVYADDNGNTFVNTTGMAIRYGDLEPQPKAAGGNVIVHSDEGDF